MTLWPRPLRRLSPAGIASCAVALTATVSSDCVLQPYFEKSLLERCIGAATVALFGMVTTSWALSREPSEWSALRGGAVSGAVVLSWFMVCDKLSSIHPAGRASSFASLVLPILVIVVAAVGAVAGTLFGVTAVAPDRRSAPPKFGGAPPKAGRCLDAAERVILPASTWLCGWGLLFIALHHPRAMAPLFLIGVGLAGLVVVAVRDVQRLWWLSALYRGKLSHWTLVPVAEQGSPRSLPAFGPYRDADLDGQLLPERFQAGPYRAAFPSEPVARLPMSSRKGMRPIRHRIALCGVLASVLVLATVARLDPTCLQW